MTPKQPEQPSPFPADFDRFDSFLRKLVAVPKAEIDRQEAKYQRKKAIRKKKNEEK